MKTSNEVIEDEIKLTARSLKSKKILDVGCGAGFFTEMFCINDNQVTGLDLQKLVDERKISFKFVQGDALKMPFADSSFDAIISFDVIEHVSNDQLFLAECRRVLKKNGQLILGTPNKYRISYFLLSLLGKRPKFPRYLGKDAILGDIIHLREYTGDEVSSLLRKAKFTVNSISTIWFGVAIKGNFQIGFSSGFLPIPSKFGFYILVIASKV